MPYGIDKDLGGDNKKNVEWMEKCVASIMKSNPGYSKQKAIKICKAQLKKNRSESEKDN